VLTSGGAGVLVSPGSVSPGVPARSADPPQAMDNTTNDPTKITITFRHLMSHLTSGGLS
jgi:hypothetical protein